MSFAPPVSRDGFHYNGDLYVEVGNLNRHKRASIPEITALLRPDLKKSKVTPNKDAVGHWYEAQLIHYGLPPSKDKARAKMRLLEALNNSSLVVPAGIIKLEQSLRKEFDAAERKAKASYKVGMANATENLGSSRKRKQPDATTVNVNINLGALSGMQLGLGPNGTFSTGTFPQVQGPPTPKKARKTAANPSTQKVTESQARSSPQNAKRSVVNAKTTMKESLVQKKPFSTLQTARKSAPGPKKEIAVKKEHGVKKEPAIKKESIKKETALKKEPPFKKEPAIKKESSIKKEPGADNQPSLGLINGYYDISCPYLESQFPHDTDSFSLILCLETPRVWGSYDLGQFRGILHLPQRPFEPSSTPLQFHWRGRELGEGEMSFGHDCFGEMAFLGNGRIAGMLNVFGVCEFTGVRRPGPTTAPRPAISMREEWEGYNEDAYEAERTGRWGGW